MSTVRSKNANAKARRQAPNRLQKARLNWNDIPCGTQAQIRAHCHKRVLMGDGFMDIVKSVAKHTWSGVKKAAPEVWKHLIKPIVLPALQKEAERRLKAKLSGSGCCTGKGLRLAGSRHHGRGSQTLLGNGKCRKGCKHIRCSRAKSGSGLKV